MNATDWAVIASGLAAILLVNWYFFFAERGTVAAAVGAGGRQDVTVVARGGSAPAAIRVKAGRPVRLLFDRQETSSCSEEVVLPDFGIRTFLPANQQTAVELTPAAPGSYEFTCGMGMMRGRLIAE